MNLRLPPAAPLTPHLPLTCRGLTIMLLDFAVVLGVWLGFSPVTGSEPVGPVAPTLPGGWAMACSGHVRGATWAEVAKAVGFREDLNKGFTCGKDGWGLGRSTGILPHLSLLSSSFQIDAFQGCWLSW